MTLHDHPAPCDNSARKLCGDSRCMVEPHKPDLLGSTPSPATNFPLTPWFTPTVLWVAAGGFIGGAGGFSISRSAPLRRLMTLRTSPAAAVLLPLLRAERAFHF